ncbi:MAG TPA: trigger factor [Rhodothermales bacterium]|nr:trigger factor [Rhodothermales bacterium]
MQTTITQVGPADYRLDVTAPADDLSPRFDAALRRQRNRVQVRGFRPGKAPLDLVRRQFGPEVAASLAEQVVQEAFDREVLSGDSYRLIGRPALTQLDYDGSGDLNASIQFGVRPQIDVDGLGDVTLTRLRTTIEEAEIDEEITRLRRRFAKSEDAEEGYTLTETDSAVLDLQQLDDDGAPVIGRVERGVVVELDDENVHDALHETLPGKQVGDTFRVTLPHGSGDHVHTHLYEVTVQEVKRRTLPDVDDALATEATNGRHETLDSLREAIREELERAAERRKRDYVESQIVEALLAKHAEVPVPEAAIELFLESFLQTAAERNGGKLPEEFDARGFAQRMRPEAEKQARWMFIRDALVERFGLSVTDEDLAAFFDREAAAAGFDGALLRRFYEGQEGSMDRLEQRLLSEKLFDRLTEGARFEEKTLEEVRAAQG